MKITYPFYVQGGFKMETNISSVNNKWELIYYIPPNMIELDPYNQSHTVKLENLKTSLLSQLEAFSREKNLPPRRVNVVFGEGLKSMNNTPRGRTILDTCQGFALALLMENQESFKRGVRSV